MRDTQLCLLASGGAELVDVDTDVVLWASDSDEDFAEEFPDILDENDVEHLQDYLEEKLHLSPREMEVMEIMNEPLEGPDDEDDDDDEDEDEDEDDELEAWNRPDDEDVIDAEVIEHE
jgi:hypothetical protein